MTSSYSRAIINRVSLHAYFGHKIPTNRYEIDKCISLYIHILLSRHSIDTNFPVTSAWFLVLIFENVQSFTLSKARTNLFTLSQGSIFHTVRHVILWFTSVSLWFSLNFFFLWFGTLIYWMFIVIHYVYPNCYSLPTFFSTFWTLEIWCSRHWRRGRERVSDLSILELLRPQLL